MKILTFCNDVLNLDLEPRDLGQSHRVGKPRDQQQPRPILVRFVTYRSREKVYRARKSLKDKGDAARGIYINEDLTATIDLISPSNVAA